MKMQSKLIHTNGIQLHYLDSASDNNNQSEIVLFRLSIISTVLLGLNLIPRFSIPILKTKLVSVLGPAKLEVKLTLATFLTFILSNLTYVFPNKF